MQRSALRSIYGNTHAKTKHGAVVSPVLDNSEQDENPSWSATPSDDDDSDGPMRRATRHSNNSDNHQQHQQHIALQKKSSKMPQLRTALSIIGDNQEPDLQPWVSGSTQSKYTVLGQKKLWHKARAQRSRHTAHTILSVDDDDNGDDSSSTRTTRAAAPSSSLDVDDAWPSSRSSSTSSYSSVIERLQAVRDGDAFRDLPSRIPSSARSSDSFSSASSSCADATQRFVVTRQKKCKFAARVLLPGQKNPLYLGRYVSEAAALAACERAYAVAMTPHSAEKQ